MPSLSLHLAFRTPTNLKRHDFKFLASCNIAVLMPPNVLQTLWGDGLPKVVQEGAPEFIHQEESLFDDASDFSDDNDTDDHNENETQQEHLCLADKVPQYWAFENNAVTDYIVLGKNDPLVKFLAACMREVYLASVPDTKPTRGPNIPMELEPENGNESDEEPPAVADVLPICRSG